MYSFLIGYQPNALSQSSETIKGLIFAMTMLPAIGNIFSVIAMKWYPINQEYHKKIFIGNRLCRLSIKM